jgi:probable selenium-dependent hydroxylase accessory protein YqeC
VSNWTERDRQALLEALAATRGLVALVGAGGKKTTLYRLARAHLGRIGITATVAIPPFPEDLGAHVIVAGTSALPTLVAEAQQHRIVAFARPSDKPDRLAGLPPGEVRRIHESAGFDVTLVKADGARSRWIKAPDPDEPQLPEGVDTVIPVVSARAIGERLREDIAHRVDRITAITGAQPGDIITPDLVARLLADEQGALKGAGKATMVPLINMVDNDEIAVVARQAARWALALTRRFDRVILASMNAESPLVEIVAR